MVKDNDCQNLVSFIGYIFIEKDQIFAIPVLLTKWSAPKLSPNKNIDKWHSCTFQLFVPPHILYIFYSRCAEERHNCGNEHCLSFTQRGFSAGGGGEGNRVTFVPTLDSRHSLLFHRFSRWLSPFTQQRIMADDYQIAQKVHFQKMKCQFNQSLKRGRCLLCWYNILRPVYKQLTTELSKLQIMGIVLK